jgi:hypothetical protein
VKTVKKLLDLFLGGNSSSAPFTLDPQALWGAVRTALIVAAATGAIAAIESFDGNDWGVFETLVSSSLTFAAEAVRRYLKGYTK